MKLVLACLSMLISSATFAGDFGTIEDRVLVMLVSSVNQVQLVSKDSKESLPEDQQLPQLIAQQLSYGYLNSINGSGRTLGSVSTKCVNTTPSGMVGSVNYHCTVNLVNGDFRLVKKGRDKSLEGPKLESSISITFDVIEAVTAKPKPVLESNILLVTFQG